MCGERFNCIKCCNYRADQVLLMKPTVSFYVNYSKEKRSQICAAKGKHGILSQNVATLTFHLHSESQVQKIPL